MKLIFKFWDIISFETANIGYQFAISLKKNSDIDYLKRFRPSKVSIALYIIVDTLNVCYVASLIWILIGSEVCLLDANPIKEGQGTFQERAFLNKQTHRVYRGWKQSIIYIVILVILICDVSKYFWAFQEGTI